MTLNLYIGGADLSGVFVTVMINGKEVHCGPARNPFGSIFSALTAYAAAPFDGYGALKAGRIITTGTLCGVVPINAACEVVVRIGKGPELRLSLQ